MVLLIRVSTEAVPLNGNVMSMIIMPKKGGCESFICENMLWHSPFYYIGILLIHTPKTTDFRIY